MIDREPPRLKLMTFKGSLPMKLRLLEKQRARKRARRIRRKSIVRRIMRWFR